MRPVLLLTPMRSPSGPQHIVAACPGGRDQACVGPVGIPELIRGPLSCLYPILCIPPLSLGSHIYYYSQPPMQISWLPLPPIYRMFCYLPISFKPEFLSMTCCIRRSQVWPLHSQLGFESSFLCGEISEAHFESNGSFSAVLGLRLPSIWPG